MVCPKCHKSMQVKINSGHQITYKCPICGFEKTRNIRIIREEQHHD